jgi:hypothetical protein
MKPSDADTRMDNVNEEDEEANEALDREIMKDLDDYRREEEIKRLKGDKSDTHDLSEVPSSPRLQSYLDSDALEGVKPAAFGGRGSGT